MRSYRNTKSFGHCFFFSLFIKLWALWRASVLKMKRQTTNQKKNSNNNQHKPTTAATPTIVTTTHSRSRSKLSVFYWKLTNLWDLQYTQHIEPLAIFCNRPNLFNSLFFLSSFIQNRKKRKKPFHRHLLCFSKKKKCVRSHRVRKMEGQKNMGKNLIHLKHVPLWYNFIGMFV